MTPSTTTTTTVSPEQSTLVPGIYKYERSFNFNEYLKELGVSYVLRTFAGLATPVVTITKDCKKVRR